MTGGEETRRSVEVYEPDTGRSCSLPDLPESVYHHTMDTVNGVPVLCGGILKENDKCWWLNSSSGVWEIYATGLKDRERHTSWVSPVGLILIGGTHQGVTTTELVPSGGPQFSLQHNTGYL